MRAGKNFDFTKLLGFETVGDRISDGIDFRDETLGAKLGAKVGAPEPDSPNNAPRLGATDD